MLDKLLWLYDGRGRVTRRQYRVACAVLVVGKLGIDALLCLQVFPRRWQPITELLSPAGGFTSHRFDAGYFALATSAAVFGLALLMLTVRRCRDVAASPWMALLLVMPVANWLVLGGLAFSASAPPPLPSTRRVVDSRQPRFVTPWWGRGEWPVVWATITLCAIVMLAIGPLAHYGQTLFVAAPFLQGFVAGVCAGPEQKRDVRAWLVSVFVLMAALVMFAYEGLFCIAMAAPMWLGIGALGLVFGRALHGFVRFVVPGGLLSLPLLHLGERLTAPPSTVYEATTEVVVQASPQQVWDHLVTFDRLQPPQEWWFRAGIAFPVHATIEGRGVGAVRKCSFSTGDFVEPIEVWDEPRLLRFTVEQCPPPMFEWNPLHDHVDAAHLHGSFAAKRGQFELVPLPDGSTLLRGTTWYVHGLHPEGYWRVFSDWLVHSIHRRVLHHIRDAAERR